jgi:anti-sigma B factor antagonist
VSLNFIDMDVGDVTIIHLTGRITLGRGTETLRQAFEEVLGRGRTSIVLDFDEVVYVDSSGLGELVLARKRVIEAGGMLKLMKLKQIMRDLIQVTRLYTIFEVFDDEPSALRSFREPGITAPAES